MEHVKPQLTPLNKYIIQLVNHGVAWEFYGIRLRTLEDLNYCLSERYRQLAVLHEQKLDAGATIAEASPHVKLMDLLQVASQYVLRAHKLGVALPNVAVGNEIAIVIGPGVILLAQCFVAAEIPSYKLPPPSHN